MRVLQLCNKPPYPPVDGGTIGMNSVTQGLLAANCQVKVLSAYSYKHPILYSRITDEYRKQTQFDSVFVNLKINPFHALYYLLTGESYHVQRFINKEFEKKVVEIVQKEDFDVIHIESLFLTPYVKMIRKYSNAKIVLRAHNVENKIWKRMLKHTRNPFKKWYLKKLYLSLKRYEENSVFLYDGIICFSENDRSFFLNLGYKKPISVIPFVITTPDPVENVIPEKNSLFHIGSMDWMPNIEGVSWFLDKVWPSIAVKLPQVKLYLAGRKMPDKFFKYNELYPNVNVLGEIDDASYFMASKELNIVPLLSGSGIRVKIIEAMCLGKTVITTAIGAEGITYTDGENLLIANTPEEFIRQIEKCIYDPSLTAEIGRNAHRLIAEEYNNEILTKELLKFYTLL